MLKIKDSVDLKELEKFGFEKIFSRDWNEEKQEWEKTDKYYYRKEITYLVDKQTGYTVKSAISIENDRNMYCSLTHLKYERELYAKFVEDTLYDLIQAGLVEKV